MKSRGFGTSPGACGELIQGQFESGKDFLVSLPIDIWSKVTISPINESESLDLIVSPINKIKTCQAAKLTLAHFGYSNFRAKIEINSDIPEGKGFASSTADISAACFAVGDLLNEHINPALISQIAKQIEPSDGIMYPGLVAYNHRDCQLIEELGSVPSVNVLIIDYGGEVDTIQYNQKQKNYSAEEKKEFFSCYEMLKKGAADNDWSQMGQAATLSSRINQRLLFKPELEKIISVAHAHNAYGVCVAHSGTIVGILLNPHEKISHIKNSFQNTIGTVLEIYRMTSIETINV